MPKILIIEDEAAIRRVLTKILTEESDTYTVEEAEDGKQGFEKIKNEDYDLVLCDIKMPKMSGEELLEAVKRLQKKLGGKRTAEAVEDIIEHRHSSWIANMLVYYDKTYGYELDSHKREQTFPLDLSNIGLEESIQQLLAIKHNIQWKNQLSD